MLNLEDITEGLIQAGLDLPTRTKAIKELEKIEAEKKADRAGSGPAKSKKQYVIALRGPKSLESQISAGYIVQVSDTYNPDNLVSDMVAAGKDHDMNTKKKANFTETWIKFFEKIKRKFIKEKGILVKTKTAVRVVFLENEEVNYRALKGSSFYSNST